LDGLLADTLAENMLLMLKQVELLFTYDLELNPVRIRAVNQKHILLMLPGERTSQRILLFHEAPPEFHRTLPANIVPDDHIWELNT